MSKNKKKRNKPYTGADAAITKPIITHVTAVNRSKSGQWWFEHKKLVRTIAIGVAIGVVVFLTIIEIVRVIFVH